MKRYQKYLALIGLALLVAACMKILNVNHPETAPVNTGVDVSIDIEVTPEEDGSSPRTRWNPGSRKVETRRKFASHLYDKLRPGNYDHEGSHRMQIQPLRANMAGSLRVLGTQDNYDP